MACTIEDHAIGRSRGGLTTKIHALTNQAADPVIVQLTGGQDGDNPELLPLLKAHELFHGPARKNRVQLLADQAYSHPSTRKELRRRRIGHTIPERLDQKARCKTKGTAGGRPAAFAADLYRLRDTVERGFGRLKQWRGIATRYDKYALTFLGGVLLASSVLHLRH